MSNLKYGDVSKRYYEFLKDIYILTCTSFESFNISEYINKYHLSKAIHGRVVETFLEKHPKIRAYKWRSSSPPTKWDAENLRHFVNKNSGKTSGKVRKNSVPQPSTDLFTVSELTIEVVVKWLRDNGWDGTLTNTKTVSIN